MLRPTRILVPTDFSDYSDKALKQALDIARQYNGKVILLHVIHSEIRDIAMDFAIPEEAIAGIERQNVESAKALMKKELEKFPAAGEVEVEMAVGIGNPYEAILDEEKARGVDLIVIASLGRTGMAKYLIGGVARNVLRGARAPVLLVK